MTSDQSAPIASTRFRRRVFDILEGGFDSPRAKLVNGFIVALIIVNVIAVVLESDTSLFDNHAPVFWAIEIFSVGIFTVEYAFRFWCWADNPKLRDIGTIRSRLKFFFSPMGIIDLLAIAPFYISILFAIDLRFLRLLRLLRLLKLSHYFHGLDLFFDVLRSEAKTIASAVLTVFLLIIVVASLMFTFEHDAQPAAFSSVLQSIWWSVVTLTTVGYGDVTPITFAGRVLAIFIMLLGVGLVALPAGILAAKFSEELKSRRETLSEQLSIALEDGIIDENERRELAELREELRLPESVLQRMLRSRTGSAAGQLSCPNCGHELTLNVSTPDRSDSDGH
jgi:voltage-gated potassium channel